MKGEATGSQISGEVHMDVQGMGGALSSLSTNKSQSALSKTNRQLEKILERLSTAKRINQAGDDAAGLGVAEQLTTQIRGFKTASQNIADATAALDIAEGAGREISDMLQRQRELAVSAKSDTLTSDERKSLNTEYQAITQEISRIAEVTNYNRQQVANGADLSSGNAQIQVGPNAGETIQIPAVDYQAISQGLQATAIDTSGGAQAALKNVDAALSSVNSQRTSVGAIMNRLSSAGDNLAVAMVNTTAAESVLRDQDMAAGLAELTKQQLLQEGAIKTFARYNEVTRNHILGLLQ
jgi:flagellin